MRFAISIAVIASLASAPALGQTRDSRTLADAKAYTDQKVAAEATQRTQVDNGLQGQIDGMQSQLTEVNGQITQLSRPQSPVVISQPPSFVSFPGSPALLQNFGTFVRASANGTVHLGLQPPQAPVGVTYRPSAVEYCLQIISASEVVPRIQAQVDANFGGQIAGSLDVPRTSSGCYAYAPPAPAFSPRAYGLSLILSGRDRDVAANDVVLDGVRITWTVVAP